MYFYAGNTIGVNSTDVISRLQNSVALTILGIRETNKLTQVATQSIIEGMISLFQVCTTNLHYSPPKFSTISDSHESLTLTVGEWYFP